MRSCVASELFGCDLPFGRWICFGLLWLLGSTSVLFGQPTTTETAPAPAPTAAAEAEAEAEAESITATLHTQAEQMRLRAHTAETFLQLAAIYEKLLEQGHWNADVLFNLGTAYAQAGQTARALAAFRRAQRLSPRDPELRANLAHLLDLESSTAVPRVWPVATKWQWLVWRDYLNLHEQLNLATLLTGILFVSASLATVNGVFNRWLGALFVVLVVLAAVTWWAAYLTWQETQMPVGVILTDCTPRLGFDESFSKVSDKGWGAGTEALRTGTQADWIRLELADGTTGCVPSQYFLSYQPPDSP